MWLFSYALENTLTGVWKKLIKFFYEFYEPIACPSSGPYNAYSRFSIYKSVLNIILTLSDLTMQVSWTVSAWKTTSFTLLQNCSVPMNGSNFKLHSNAWYSHSITQESHLDFILVKVDIILDIMYSINKTKSYASIESWNLVLAWTHSEYFFVS